MNLFGILFTRKKDLTIRKSTYNHESIHTEQYKDLMYILFLPLYLLEWIIKIPFSWFYKKKQKNGREVTKVAYRSISLEQEAYYHTYDYDYLNTRKRYAWIKYIFTMYDPEKVIDATSYDEYIDI
jgi:hypothetical protein